MGEPSCALVSSPQNYNGDGMRLPITLGEDGLSTREVGMPEVGEGFHSAPGAGQGLGDFSLAYEGLSEHMVIMSNQILAVDGFRQEQCLTCPSLGSRPVLSIEG